MCSQIIVTIKPRELSQKFGLAQSNVDSIDLRVHGYMKTEMAPVIVADEKGNLTLREMCFSLCPSWSKEFPYPWSSYNARMERPKVKRDSKTGRSEPLIDPKTDKPQAEFIYEVPTWRDSFNQGATCLVPMTQAVKSSYFGKSAGNLVRFSQKKQELFFSAGLWSQWADRKTGEIKETFTLITDNPYRFFFDHGHDRSIFVLDNSKQEEWLLNKKLKPVERFNFLRSNRVGLDWDVELERPMKKGWEKRKPSDEEIESVEVWGG